MLGELKNVTTTYPSNQRVDTTAVAAPTAAPAPTVTTADGQTGNAQSPRIQIDPTAGVILQFLDSKGRVETQSPSFVAVAYLKAGLTRDGTTKPEDSTTNPAPVTA
jgi:hypothetical protein